MPDKKIRAIIVDDSATVRQMLTSILESDPQIEVVASAEDPMDAREKIKLHNPDVITLDVEMPKMNGLDFLEKIMRLRPMPVVMVSSLTQRGAQVTLQALEMGAVDYVPKITSSEFNDARSRELIEKVKTAARANVSIKHARDASSTVLPSQAPYREGTLLAVGSSTGGVEALRMVVPLLPKDAPPMVITQHMPPLFTASFARRLDTLSAVKVQEAEHGMVLEAGNVYIAPGAQHMRVRPRGGNYLIDIQDGPLVSGHKPSVDALFESVTQAAGKYAVAAILTGMGRDGADAMQKLRKAGAYTIAQDEGSCVVYGMPKAAVDMGAVDTVLPLEKIAGAMINAASQRHSSKRGIA